MTKNAFFELVNLKYFLTNKKNETFIFKKKRDYSIIIKDRTLKNLNKYKNLILSKFFFENGDFNFFLEKILFIIFQRSKIFSSIDFIFKEILEYFPKSNLTSSLEKMAFFFFNLIISNFQNNIISERVILFRNALVESKGNYLEAITFSPLNQTSENFTERIELHLEQIRVYLDNWDYSGAGAYINKFFGKSSFSFFSILSKICFIEHLVRIFSFSKELNIISKLYLFRIESGLQLGLNIKKLKQEITTSLAFFIHSLAQKDKKPFFLLFFKRILENSDQKLIFFLLNSNYQFPKNWTYFKNFLPNNILKISTFNQNNLLRSIRTYFILKNLNILFDYYSVSTKLKFSILTELDIKDFEHWVMDIGYGKKKIKFDSLKKIIRTS